MTVYSHLQSTVSCEKCILHVSKFQLMAFARILVFKKCNDYKFLLGIKLSRCLN